MRKPKEHFTEAHMARDLAARLMHAWGDGLGGAVCLDRRNEAEERRFLLAGKAKIDTWIAEHPEALLSRSTVRPEVRPCPFVPERLCLRLEERLPFPGETLTLHQRMRAAHLAQAGLPPCHRERAPDYLRRLAELDAQLSRKPPK